MPGLVSPVRDERDGLLSFLAQQRLVLEVTAHGLTDDQARRASTVSPLTVGGLIKHAAIVERQWIGRVLGRGEEEATDYEDGFTLGADETLAGVLDLYHRVADVTAEVTAGLDLGQPVPVPRDEPWFPDDVEAWSVRWVLLHLIEETARHAGHADIVREAIDGATAYSLLAAVEGWPATEWVQPWAPTPGRPVDGAPAMSEPEVFVLADRALERVVAQIADDQWSMVMPESFATSRRPERPTLRQVINYHAYDDAWVPDMLAGRTMDEVGPDAFGGDLLGDDPVTSFSAIVATACAAARAVTDLDATVHCSFGDYTVAEYLWQINSFRALRAHDIARVIGVDPALPDELVRGVFDEVSPHAEEWRAMGVFPAAVPVAASAPLLDRLLALTGRDPTASSTASTRVRSAP
ncbi:MAG TPA: DUF664 domain-containing protein [Acidimicrobiales bacterium]|nr:DUF664 domain-containing protein [Acidimicrobiales bacterium]